jgi:hypothetical protein
MVGCFSFGNKEDYPKAIDIWLSIVKDLGLQITSVHVHPDSNHRILFENKGDFEILDDQECVWCDGIVGGYCSEFYIGDIEIGNLVNPMNDSVDVGFGFDRICRLLDIKYDKTYDLEQFLEHCWKYKIEPGPKGRNHTVKKILRKYIREQKQEKDVLFQEWIRKEEKKLKESFKIAKNMLKKHFHKSDEWWYDCVGLLPEEVKILKENKNV